MKNSSLSLSGLHQVLSRNKREIKGWQAGIFTAVGALGFADALYLTIQHYQHVIPPCTIEGCETVLTSAYSVILGVPVSLLGAVFYACVIALSIVYIDKRNYKVLNALFLVTHLGLIASLYFLFLQAFVINAWCQYCLLSAATSIILWLKARWFSRKAVTIAVEPVSISS
ncbi:MAG: vitamin K epoxide reductase family protein [Patescibacteria group bacterium]